MTSLGLIPEERKTTKSNNIASNSLDHLCVLRKKKLLHPLFNPPKMASSYNNRTNYQNGDKHITKRILSAKDHRLKQLQNQLADAHYHLNELTNENRLLRNLQKRMDSALQRYEGIDGDIPKIFNSHNEEIRSWQTRFKQLKNQLKETNQKLKNKEMEFQQLNDEHKHLLNLCKDSKLCEREKLQLEVNELKVKLEKQTESVNNLQKRLHFETKSHKQQLNAEIRKHKETQSKLNNASLENKQLHSIIEEKETAIKSLMIKKISKMSHANPGKNVIKKDYDKNSFYLNLTDNVKSTSDSHVSSDSKTENQSNFTFTVSENKISNENETSSDSNMTKMLKEEMIGNDTKEVQNISEGEKELISDINENVKKRIDLLKTQLSQEKMNKVVITTSKSKRLSKPKAAIKKNVCGSNSDSTPEELLSSSNSDPKDHLTFLNSQKKIVDDDDEYIDNDYINSLNYFDVDGLDKKCQELEESAARERFVVEAVLEDYTNDILRTPENTIKYTSSNILKGVNSRSFIENESKSTLNKNSKNPSEKISNLDEDKKKKLLETLKAIDRGDDDGLNIESISKVRMQKSKIN